MIKIPVIDSHVHLFHEEGLDRLAWMTPDHKLYGNHRLQEYARDAVSDQLEVQGVIFMETDVQSGLDEDDWVFAVEEYAYVSALGDGFIRAMIPWAPVPVGAKGLSKYVDRLKTKGSYKNVKGFRYLLQDKPSGTMLQQGFIEGLNWLGEQGYTFDLGIDMHSAGVWQLEEFAEVDKRTENVTYIVNHLTKPDLANEVLDLLPEIREIWTSIWRSSRNRYFIKLSGAFSEMPESLVSGEVKDIADRIKPWIKMFVEIFGPEKIIWGSDWPVSTLKVASPVLAWKKWTDVCQLLLEELEIPSAIYCENVKIAYDLD
jgi:L-rhamnono-1,4-lactonase